ncbi:MAG: tetraacyldisaccharide 4'-kinase [Acidobacteriaceae bacterium]
MKSTRRKSLLWQAASPVAWPFVPLYALAVRFKDAAYGLGLLKPARLAWPVISVGNLSVGGTGKTPMVIFLAGLLQARGWRVDVLSRGYRRRSRDVAAVDPEGDAEMFGDEPLLLARRGLPVYVGADRFQAGQMAEGGRGAEPDNSCRVHILDDGFQHRKLRRAVDIVLLQRGDLEDDMLPVGRLRESLSALQRADICVLRAEDADLQERVLQLMGGADPARIWIMERRTILPEASSKLPFSTPHVVAFCGLGDSHGFFDGLRCTGLQITKEVAFRDHHAYTQEDIARLKAVAQLVGAQCFVTTEKDSMRLAGGLRAELEKQLPLIVAGLEISLDDEAAAMKTLESLLAASNGTLLRDRHSNVR